MESANDNSLPRSRAEGRKIGSQFYFTGKACKNGHVDRRSTKKGQCVACNRERVAKWTTEFPEKKKAQNHNRYWKDPDESRAKALAYAKEHRQEASLRARKWEKDNPERAAANYRSRRARKRGNGGRHTGADIEDILRLQKFRCGYCNVSVRKKKDRHVDHIKPLIKGGTNDRRNLQVLCPTCNLSKKAKDPIDYARSLGKLV